MPPIFDTMGSVGGDWKGMIEAAKEGHYSTMRMHIESGFDLNYQHPEFFTTPLMEAARYGHLDIVKLLIESGASPSVKSAFDNLTALDLARQEGREAVAIYLETLPKNGY